MITAASASASSAQTIELASPPPKRPSAGSPKWPKISAQPSNALRMIPTRLIAEHPARPLERGDEIAHRLEQQERQHRPHVAAQENAGVARQPAVLAERQR